MNPLPFDKAVILDLVGLVLDSLTGARFVVYQQ